MLLIQAFSESKEIPDIFNWKHSQMRHHQIKRVFKESKHERRCGFLRASLLLPCLISKLPLYTYSVSHSF